MLVDGHVRNRDDVLLVLLVIALGVVALGVGAGVGSAAGQTITVDDSGGADYTSIQPAVDAATAGDTVEVRPGTYAGTVTVNKDITIVAPQGATLDNGASPDRTYPLEPDRTNSAFIISAQAEPTIEGFTIRNYRGAAIYAFGSTGDWTVRNVLIHNVSIGLGATQSEGAWVFDAVRIQDATAAIFAGDTTGEFVIRDSTLQSNRVGLGAFRAAGDWTMHNTTVADHPDFGISAIDTTGAWSIQESRFSGNHVAINATGATPAGSATHNWWGACDGPSGDFGGSGDAATGNLDVEPYYTDAAQTTLSDETTSPCAETTPFDFGVELQQSATVSQGSNVNITVYPYSNVDQSVTGTTVELFVDTDADGQFESSEVVADRSADFGPNEYRMLNLTYTNVQLAPGDYRYMAQIRKDGQTVQSFTNGTLTVTAGPSVTPAITFQDQTVANGSATVTVDSATAGSAYYIEITDASGTTLGTTTTFTAGAQQTDRTVSLGQSLTANTTLTATVHAAADDSALASDTAAITVTDQVFTTPVGGGQAPPQDPDDDGLYEDVDGDGQANFNDAVALAFINSAQLTPQQLAALDFDGDGDLDFNDAIELAFSV